MDHSHDHSQHTLDHSNHGLMPDTTGAPIEHHTPMPNGSMDHHEGMGHMGMKMYFHFSLGDLVLFDFWKVDTVGTLISSMIGIFVAAMLYEGLKYFREYLYWKNYNMLQYTTVNKPTNQENERVINNVSAALTVEPTTIGATFPSVSAALTVEPTTIGATFPSLVSDVIHRQPPKLLSSHHMVQTGLHIIQIFMSYLLMLIFMTYNVWLCIAVVLGSATGYFLFGWRKSLFVDVTEHCH